MIAMKYFIILSCLAVAALAAAAGQKYTNKFDNLNVKEILENKRLLLAYVDCIMEKEGAKCTPEGKELKEHLREALANGCELCTDKQREGTEIVIRHLIEHEDAIWKQLTAKFDPTGEFRKKYEALAKDKGIKIPGLY